MKQTSKATVFIILLIFVCACAAQTVSAPEPVHKPEWLWKPSDGGKIGGVGIAKEHIHGLDAQRKLAVSRAIDSIAAQLGVQVQNVTVLESHATSSGSSSTTIDSYSIHTVQGNTVKAAVREFWTDVQTGELYVWMVLE
ncbi:hypothetical protein EP073_07990 [Geovibrio thiophilus]|uniref:Uncharacterized protein n=1 Tax=Geovibrio thiophilus TaxID=139438 RepID=A0A3R5Y757_9BACT|nr:hypothetical protein [Geovibrio thiophilus]QAR33342.1 hypothetical protein EP073_07990 [Geovibrio thiophilus]